MSSAASEWDPIPSYFEFFHGVYKFVIYSPEKSLAPSDKDGDSNSVWKHCQLGFSDLYIMLCMAAAWTVLRYVTTEWCFKPAGQYFMLTPANQKKMPESAWKFLYYVSSWSFGFYVIYLQGKYRFFQSPTTLWDDWRIDSVIPTDIYILYMIQISFYFHSLYGTLYLDTWRKDSLMMMLHHVLTLALLFVSYIFRYHCIGSLTFLLHDVCDIQLEFTKLNVYFKIQGGKQIKIFDNISSIMFCIFTATWYLTRLYWYPLKIVYAATSIIVQKQLFLPYQQSIHILLWILQILNIYWFMYIVGFLVRVATGQMKEVDDTREYDVEEEAQKQYKSKHINHNEYLVKNGHSKQNGVSEQSEENHNKNLGYADGVAANGNNNSTVHLRSRSQQPSSR